MRETRESKEIDETNKGYVKKSNIILGIITFLSLYIYQVNARLDTNIIYIVFNIQDSIHRTHPSSPSWLWWIRDLNCISVSDRIQIRCCTILFEW